jgi:hypothetical protein
MLLVGNSDGQAMWDERLSVWMARVHGARHSPMLRDWLSSQADMARDTQAALRGFRRCTGPHEGADCMEIKGSWWKTQEIQSNLAIASSDDSSIALALAADPYVSMVTSSSLSNAMASIASRTLRRITRVRFNRAPPCGGKDSPLSGARIQILRKREVLGHLRAVAQVAIDFAQEELHVELVRRQGGQG